MKEIASLLAGCRFPVAFTGAGISTESGLSDYRSQAGMWQKYDPFTVATGEVLLSDPERFFSFYRERLQNMSDVEPNRGHLALARLEAAGLLQAVITQNVDGLHQKAGSQLVVELHGSLARCRCMSCHGESPIETLAAALREQPVPRCECGGVLRPGVVLFGEGLPPAEWSRAREFVRQCDAMIVVGSSLTVWPAAGLPEAARRRGARLVVVNAEPTPLDGLADVVCRDSAGAVLESVADMMAGEHSG